MKVIILAGGFGTRLSEETAVIPKPMIDLGNRPLLWHIMKIFSSYGFNDFLIAMGYKSEAIKQYFLQLPNLESDLRINLGTGEISKLTDFSENWKIDLVHTGHDTMTGGRLKRLRNKIDGPTFITYGDGLSNIDLKKLLAFHKSHGKLATVTTIRPPQRFGVLELDNNKVTRFNEKIDCQESWINGGFFVVEPEALDCIESDQTTWELEPCNNLARDGQLMAYKHDGYWQCVDTLHELRELRNAWNSNKAPWKVWD